MQRIFDFVLPIFNWYIYSIISALKLHPKHRHIGTRLNGFSGVCVCVTNLIGSDRRIWEELEGQVKGCK